MSDQPIQLSDNAKAHIAGVLNNGNYGDASDYIESLIREDQLTRKQLGDTLAQDATQLEQQALEGLNSGEPITVDAQYWQSKRQHLTQEFRSKQ